MKFEDLDIEDCFWAFNLKFIKISYIKTLKCNAVRLKDWHLCFISDDQEVSIDESVDTL